MQSLSRVDYKYIDFSAPSSLLSHAKKLEGHTFREVLDLGIVPEGVEREYNSRRYKGGMGTLIEERYFGYKANSDANADFAEAGTELKVTCCDERRDGSLRAGERLVLTMIPFDEEIEPELEASHLWAKAAKILLIYYIRDKTIDPYDQTILSSILFTPPRADLEIIKRDYNTIREYVRSGRAHELSESLTTYLGACTKGASAEKSIVDQLTYAPGIEAKRRAFCFKSSYMNTVLNEYILGNEGGESIIKVPAMLVGRSFEEIVLSLVAPYVGKSDRELCAEFDTPYTGNKAQWSTLAYRMLGLRGEKAEEFEKANISVRTVRLEENGKNRENLSLDTFAFVDLVKEEWEDAALHNYFDETRFFFVVFRRAGDEYRLAGARFWSMPVADIEGPLRECWQRTVDTVRNGVHIEAAPWGEKLRYKNNLPKQSENRIAHVRPHTSRAAYRFEDGRTIGDVERDADELPDGRAMTKQSFWLNNSYINEIVVGI